jgi:hypothetical protein
MANNLYLIHQLRRFQNASKQSSNLKNWEAIQVITFFTSNGRDVPSDPL